MRRWVATPVLAAMLMLGASSSALADPSVPGVAPTSIFGGTYFAMSEDGMAVGFKMPDGHVRWEINGVPISNYGVNDVAQATVLGFDAANVLVVGGNVRGVFFAASADGTAMGYRMPDGSIRWEMNGEPIATH